MHKSFTGLYTKVNQFSDDFIIFLILQFCILPFTVKSSRTVKKTSSYSNGTTVNHGQD